MAPEHLPATAAELLRRWIRNSPLKHAEIARLLEITPAHLSNVSNGKDGASDELKERIQVLTSISASLWDEIEPVLPPAAAASGEKGRAA